MMQRTSADVFALGIDARTILTGLRTLAFVHVCTIAAGTVQFITVLAFTAKHTEDILATSIDAQITEHLAFIYIDTRLFVTLVRMHKTHLALTTISTRIIQAMSVFAECIILRTLVDVLTRVAVTAETGIAHALDGNERKKMEISLKEELFSWIHHSSRDNDNNNLERAFGVDAVCIGITATIIHRALIDIPTLDTVPGETLVAGAHVWALCVLAFGEFAARVCVQSAFVVVGTSRSLRRFHGISFLAATIEGADRIVTLTVTAHSRLRRTLVDI